MDRRNLLALMAASAAMPRFAMANQGGAPAYGGWVKHPTPVLGGQYGTCFDICVLRDEGRYRMWMSWRPMKSVAYVESTDGINWPPPQIVLAPYPDTGWEDDISRPIVVHREDGYHMWYTGAWNGGTAIGYAVSEDGKIWWRKSLKPVVAPELKWEGVALMCPHVEWDSAAKLWKMWYSGGEAYEPNAIGFATSHDGLVWTKHPANPVLTPDKTAKWEQDRVTAAQVFFHKGWYYAFYIGFSDIHSAQIGLARSADGISNWERHPDNPIVRPTPGGWDADACYKPFVVFADGRWMLWYNGRREHFEQIGLVTHEGEDFGFPAATAKAGRKRR